MLFRSNASKEFVIRNNTELSPFFTTLGLKGDDIISSINGVVYTIDTISNMMEAAQNLKEGDTITLKIKRNGKEQTISGKATLTYEESEGYHAIDTTKQALREAWLKR